MTTHDPATPPPQTDDELQTLGLVALHRLAQQGSSKARAELTRRMRAEARAGNTHSRRDTASADNVEAQAERLQLLAQMAPEHSRTDGPPRLVGLLLICWGVLLALGGLILLVQMGSAYYLFCGLACGAVGHLLMRCSWWAVYVHIALIVLALAWGWYSDGNGLAALVSALPLLAPALWLAAPTVRAPLN